MNNANDLNWSAIENNHKYEQNSNINIYILQIASTSHTL